MARNILITRRDWRENERELRLCGGAWALRMYFLQTNPRKKLSCWIRHTDLFDSGWLFAWPEKDGE